MKLKKLKGWFTVTDIQIGPITDSNQLTNERTTMSRVDNDYTEHMNKGGWQERPEPLHLNLSNLEALKLQEAIDYIQQHGLRVVPANWKVQ